MTEWLIPANPKKYNVIDAFNEKKVLEWRQTVNIESGYILK